MSYIVTCNLQPIGRFQGQATDVDIARKEIRNVKIEMVLFFFYLL
jgi:ATP-dependent protease ClpP protease subunit